MSGSAGRVASPRWLAQLVNSAQSVLYAFVVASARAFSACSTAFVRSRSSWVDELAADHLDV